MPSKEAMNAAQKVVDKYGIKMLSPWCLAAGEYKWVSTWRGKSIQELAELIDANMDTKPKDTEGMSYYRRVWMPIEMHLKLLFLDDQRGLPPMSYFHDYRVMKDMDDVSRHCVVVSMYDNRTRSFRKAAFYHDSDGWQYVGDVG